MVFGFFFSWAGDTIKRKQIISVTLLRKLATIFCKHEMRKTVQIAIESNYILFERKSYESFTNANIRINYINITEIHTNYVIITKILGH